MLEREVSHQERSSQKELAKKIINSFEANVGFLKSIQPKDLKLALPIFAENFAIFSTQQRILIEQEIDNDNFLKCKAAYSLATTGDFSKADLNNIKIDQGSGNYPGTLDILLKIVQERRKFNLDYLKSFFQIANKVGNQLKGNENYYPRFWLPLAKTAKDLNLDPKPFLEYVSTSTDGKPNIETIGLLVAHGFIDEGLSLVSLKEKDRKLSGVLKNLSVSLVEQGRFTEAVKYANSISKETLVEITAKCAVEKARLNQSPNLYIQETEELLIKGYVVPDYQIDAILSLAQAAQLSKNNPNPYYDRVVMMIAKEDDLHSKIVWLRKILVAQKDSSSFQKETLSQALLIVSRLEKGVPEELDKMDRIEVLMELEDTVHTFIDLGLLDLAQTSLISLAAIYKQEGDDSKDIILEFEAKIVAKKIVLGLNLDQIKALSKEEISALLKSNNFNLHKALGYFQLVETEEFKTLPPQTQIAILSGIRLKADVEQGQFPDLFEIYNNSKDSQTTRVFIKTFDNKEDGDVEILRNMLEGELAGDKDYQTISRIIKRLIELDDKKGKEVATQIFMDESVPKKIRLYIARKLCDSAHWDREIIQYFKNYEYEGTSRKLLIDVKLDSLNAIITQMHITPSLEMYKILERTRKSKDKQGLLEIASFGNHIFLLSNLELKDKLDIFSFWAEKHEKKEIDFSQLEELALDFKELSEAEKIYRQHHQISQSNSTLLALLSTFYKEKNINKTAKEIIFLLRRGIFPTEELIKSAKNNPQIEEQIIVAKRGTGLGKFDKNNILQRDVEFTKYLLISNDVPKDAYKTFANLKTINIEQKEIELNKQEMIEANSAAFEAALLYHHVRELVDLGRKVTVVGNQRYGDYFCLDPLRPFLQELGIKTLSYKVSSSQTKPDDFKDVFPVSFIKSLIEDKPDAIIVDGTGNLFDEQGNVRLTRALGGYLNWFHAFNDAAGRKTLEDPLLIQKPEYKKLVEKISSYGPTKDYNLAFFSPMAQEKINIGDTVLKYADHGGKHPVVIFANPVILPEKYAAFPTELKTHKPGYFDDPEKYTNPQKVVAFTKKGVRDVITGRGDETQFVFAVQTQMQRVLPQMINRTNPLAVK